MWEGFPKEGTENISRECIVVSWENYYQTGPELIEAVFKVVNASWKPMYVVPEWIETRLEKCLAFAEVYRSLAERHANAAFVETQGLLSNHQKKDNGDMIHFCRESLYELGHRYFDAFCKLI